MNGDFQYILRFAIDPGFEEEAILTGLLSFCEQASIDDVALFTAGEEINSGHMTLEELAPWIDLFQRAKKRLNAIGVLFSINHWTSFMPAERGRKLAEAQRFTKMTDPKGNVSEVAVCPLCHEFRGYFLDVVRQLGALLPNIFWIDDDFRFHNHEPLEWGGCFCELHMDEYSKAASKKLTREEFVNGVLKVGEPHPYREIWLDCCRETLEHLAEGISKAMREVSPDTRVGLMSSDPSVHCAEGRDWNRLLSAFAGNNPITHRIHLPSYLERTPQEYLWSFNTVSMPCQAAGPEDAEIYPELENFPFSLFTKSLNFTRFQIELALALNIHGITLDLFDILGSGVHLEDGHQKNLAMMKPFLQACNASGFFHGERQGVYILFSPDSSRTLHTGKGVSFEELYPEETFWAGVFGGMGVPFVYCREPQALSGRIAAVSGQFFRNLTHPEIDRLFSTNFVIMDGLAAQVLCDMGLGKLAGLLETIRQPQNTGVVCYEEALASDAGCAVPRAAAQVFLGDAILCRYSEGAREVSVLKNHRRKDVAPGLVVFEERCMVFPFHCKHYPPMVFNRVRQAMMQRELVRAAEKFKLPLLIQYGIHTAAYVFERGTHTAVYLANATTDNLREVTLWFSEFFGGDITILRSGSCAVEPLDSVRNGDRLTLAVNMDAMSCAFLFL